MPCWIASRRYSHPYRPQEWLARHRVYSHPSLLTGAKPYRKTTSQQSSRLCICKHKTFYNVCSRARVLSYTYSMSQDQLSHTTPGQNGVYIRKSLQYSQCVSIAGTHVRAIYPATNPADKCTWHTALELLRHVLCVPQAIGLKVYSTLIAYLFTKYKADDFEMQTDHNCCHATCWGMGILHLCLLSTLHTLQTIKPRTHERSAQQAHSSIESRGSVNQAVLPNTAARNMVNSVASPSSVHERYHQVHGKLR